MESPEEGKWLFFVTVDKNGRTVFSDTYEQHLAAVEEAQKGDVLNSRRQ